MQVRCTSSSGAWGARHPRAQAWARIVLGRRHGAHVVLGRKHHVVGEMIAGGCGEDTERVGSGVMVSRNVRGHSVAYLDIPCCTGF
jgi:hypothetical protein